MESRRRRGLVSVRSRGVGRDPRRDRFSSVPRSRVRGAMAHVARVAPGLIACSCGSHRERSPSARGCRGPARTPASPRLRRIFDLISARATAPRGSDGAGLDGRLSPIRGHYVITALSRAACASLATRTRRGAFASSRSAVIAIHRPRGTSVAPRPLVTARVRLQAPPGLDPANRSRACGVRSISTQRAHQLARVRTRRVGSWSSPYTSSSLWPVAAFRTLCPVPCCAGSGP